MDGVQADECACSSDNGYWTEVITSQRGIFDLRLHDVWVYRDLLWMLVRRDFVAYYKQTVLGPIWFFLQPLFTTIVFTIVFGKLAKLTTDGIPAVLFYMSGITCWNYFSDCLLKTSTVFRDNQNVFGKVYFPRLVVPLSIVLSNLIRLAIQLTLLAGFFLYFFAHGAAIRPNLHLLLFPCLVAMMALLALGLGMMVTSLTAKYRDLAFLLQFGIQLLMYATPVIYPLSVVPERFRWLFVLNPLSSVVETFRLGLLGTGSFEWWHLALSFAVTLLALLAGTVVFVRAEKSFMDTV